MKRETREVRVVVRFSTDENAILQILAAKEKLSISTYVRRLVLLSGDLLSEFTPEK